MGTVVGTVGVTLYSPCRQRAWVWGSDQAPIPPSPAATEGLDMGRGLAYILMRENESKARKILEDVSVYVMGSNKVLDEWQPAGDDL